MSSKLFAESNDRRQFVVGMVHALPLPESPHYDGDWDSVRAAAVRDARALAEGGVQAVMVENFGDVPFFPGRVPAVTVAAMTTLATEIRQATDLPLGINVLRNDGISALAVAVAARAEFIRVNVLTGARVTDQGVIPGIAHDLLRERRHWRADAVQIWADVDVKHSAPLAARPLADEVADLIHRGGADAVIVSGSGTGQPTDATTVREVRAAAGSTPVIVGSGVTLDGVGAFSGVADGFIVGTAFKSAGDVRKPVETTRVRAFMDRVAESA